MSTTDLLDNEVRVRFEIPILEDGYPPISSEFLLGFVEEDTKVRIDNTPFFAEEVALGDVVICTGSAPDFTFDYVYKESGNRAVSVIFIDNDFAEILFQTLRELGCYSELGEFPEYNMLAICIPIDIDYHVVKSILDSAEDSGKISYAELCI